MIIRVRVGHVWAVRLGRALSPKYSFLDCGIKWGVVQSRRRSDWEFGVLSGYLVWTSISAPIQWHTNIRGKYIDPHNLEWNGQYIEGYA